MKAQRKILLVGFAVFTVLVGSCAQTGDARMTASIKSQLAVDDRVRASEINVDTANGVVTLTGNVDSQDARDRAVQVARETSGVRDVKDMISVRIGLASGDAPEPGRDLGERLDDTGISMRVKGRLVDDPLVKGLQIDVDTRDGVVYLTGTVPGDAERKQAIELARTTEGVKDVQANFK